MAREERGRTADQAVPTQDVQIRAADAGVQHADHNLVRTGDRIGQNDQFEPGSGNSVEKGLHTRQ